MKGREKAAGVLAAVLAAGITGYSAWKLLVTGLLSWHLEQPETAAMMKEMTVVWLILFLAAWILLTDRWPGFHSRILRPVIQAAAGLAVLVTAGVVCWLHAIFLPVLFSGLYVGYLAVAGMWFCRTFLRKRLNLCWNFLMGSAVTITVFCLLSLAGLGSIRKLRAWVAVSGLVLLIWWLRLCRREVSEWKAQVLKSQKKFSGVGCAMMLAAIAALVLMQASRLNLAVDFDSIWYGVRSHVMLDSGNGIYENLGTLGVVYTYSKGFEVLGLPFAGLPSYSFSTAFNIWICVLVLAAACKTAQVCLEPRQALWAPFLMAAVPGIMNMAVTAKADLMTVFCQILMVQGSFLYLRERRADWLIAGMAAGGLSLTMKPTAVVYSPAIVGMSLLWIVGELAAGWKKGKKGNDKTGKRTGLVVKNRRSWLMLIPSAAALAGIWGRTCRLVGVPVTSVFYGVFQKLGFQVKYPFYASGFPSAGSGETAGGKVMFLLKRLYGILLNPQGDDMAHVIIAWGTVLPLVLFLIWAVPGRLAGRTEKTDHAGKAAAPGRYENAGTAYMAGRYLAWLVVPLAFVNLVSLYSLSQIDGNYYMLFYVLVILAGVVWIGSRPDGAGGNAGSGRENSAGRSGISRWYRGALLPVWCFGVVLCFLTNWAWALGNGGLQPVNRGYYSHVEAEHQKRVQQGSGMIWDLFASDPKNRVIALGEHPGVLTFPCWVQSYVDVSGYWGNPQVVSDAPNFLEYLQFAAVDYIYMEKEYVDTSVRIYQIVRTLVEQGWLYDVRDETGNLVLTVRKGQAGGTPEEIAGNLQVFDERYVQHP